MRRAAVRALVVPLAACVALLLATPVRAHNVLTGSDPANGAKLAAMPERVTLTFDQAVRREYARIAVTGPDGGRYEHGEVGVSGTAVFIGVLPSGPAGEYSIGYRIVSNDGHPVTGTITFTVTGTATGGPGSAATVAPAQTPSATAEGAAPPSPSPGSALPPDLAAPVSSAKGGWVWTLLAVTAALLALSTLVLVRHDRRGRSAA